MGDTQTIVKVGIADLNIVNTPHIIRTSGLGSCVGVVLYDLSRQVAGLAHVMLPDSSLAKKSNLNEFKYADTAIDYLVYELCTKGARKYALQAKLAGGAQMFQFESSNDLMRIGPRNVQAVQEKLGQYRIPVIAMDVGGNSGRTIDFDPATGNLKIRTVNKSELVI
ncbi:chemotaxis protein CheD [Virgibacillus sp. L01]|uniref:chemotaxis protein CheD n=1 Tax=Virgibacillus sp. L01 TaxID=3457429 RepID=UPI003FD54722